MTRVVIRVVGLAGKVVRGDDDSAPGYVSRYDPEAHDGLGMVELTQDPEQALVFPSHRMAIDFYRQRPRCRPTRDDGRPNRPMTAFHVLIEELATARRRART